LRVAPENFRVAAQAFHAFLDARAARIDHPDDWRAVFGCQIHHAADFAAVHLTQGAALHGEILGVNVHRTPVHLAVASHHAVSQRGFGLRVVLLHHQSFQLPETAFVKQQQNAFARGEAALGVLLVNTGLTAAQLSFRKYLVELFQAGIYIRHIAPS